MKYLVISDTHGILKGLEQAIAENPDFDGIIHLGDVEHQDRDIQRMIQHKAYIQVCGNCDFYGEYPAERMAIFGNHRVYMVHGHLHGVKISHERIKSYAAEGGCDVIFYGHTHQAMIEEEDGFLIANPGSLTCPRGKERRRSYIVMTTDEKGEIHLELRFLQS